MSNAQETEETLESLDMEEHRTRMDAGLVAWLQVLASWLLFLNTWGLTNSYGVFQTYYSTSILHSTSASSIAWIGSLQTFLTMFVGAFACFLLDSGYLRSVMLTGSLFEVIGMVMTSFGRTYWQLLLAQGVCVGIGSGLLAITSLAILPPYFKKLRMLASGIAATGSSFAGVVYPLLMRKLIETTGFPWAARALALVILVTLSTACYLVQPIPSARVAAPFHLRAFKDLQYTSLVLSFTLTVAAIFVPYFYVGNYAIALGLNANVAFYLLSIMNATSLLGRVLPNYLADKYGGINILIPCNVFAAIIFFLWPFSTTQSSLITIGSIYTFIAGGMMSVFPLTIAELTGDPAESSMRMGMAYTVASIGALTGNPIAGQFERSGRSSTASKSAIQIEYKGVWYFAAIAISIATTLLIFSRYLAVGFKVTAKV